MKRRKIDAKVIAVQTQREEPRVIMHSEMLRETTEKTNKTKREELLVEAQTGTVGDMDRMQKSKERK